MIVHTGITSDNSGIVHCNPYARAPAYRENTLINNYVTVSHHSLDNTVHSMDHHNFPIMPSSSAQPPIASLYVTPTASYSISATTGVVRIRAISSSGNSENLSNSGNNRSYYGSNEIGLATSMPASVPSSVHSIVPTSQAFTATHDMNLDIEGNAQQVSRSEINNEQFPLAVATAVPTNSAPIMASCIAELEEFV